MNFEAQALYGMVVIAVTVSNLFLYRSVIRTARRNRWLVWDIVIKCVALGLSALYPPTIMFVTLIAGVFLGHHERQGDLTIRNNRRQGHNLAGDFVFSRSAGFLRQCQGRLYRCCCWRCQWDQRRFLA